MKTKYFVNYTDRDFTYTWNKEPWTFKAGEKMKLQDYLAEHFSKHLADRELQRDGFEVDHFSRPSYIAKALIDEETSVDHSSEVRAEVEILNQNVSMHSELEENKPRRGRPPLKKVEEVFEGLEK